MTDHGQSWCRYLTLDAEDVIKPRIDCQEKDKIYIGHLISMFWIFDY